MKLGVFAVIPQLNAKVLNGSHQHHQKAKKFVFKSQKWRKCLCVSMTARELFTTSLSLRDKLSLEVFIWVIPVEDDSPCPARVLITRQLVSASRQCTGSLSSCCKRIFSPKTSVRAVLHHSPYSPDLSPFDYLLFPRLKLHWKGASLKIFKTSKQLWHRVFGSYHKKTCRGPSSLC